MGQDFRECSASAFPVIGEAYTSAWSGRRAYLEKMRMFLDRDGFLEETWFTFSFSPITDESGGVGGLFHPVTEMTTQMLSEQHVTLRDLANLAGKAKTMAEASPFPHRSSQPLSWMCLFFSSTWSTRRRSTRGWLASTASHPERA